MQERLMIISCPFEDCKEPMKIQDWTSDIVIATCIIHKIRKYYSKSKERFLTHTEMQTLQKEWQ